VNRSDSALAAVVSMGMLLGAGLADKTDGDLLVDLDVELDDDLLAAPFALPLPALLFLTVESQSLLADRFARCSDE
jgi:hypothetical protein